MNRLGSQLEYLVKPPYDEYTYEETQWLAFYMLCRFEKNLYFDLEISSEKANRYRKYIVDLIENGEAKTYGVSKKLIKLFNRFKLDGFRPYKGNSKDAVDIVPEIRKEHEFLLNHIITLDHVEDMIKLFGTIFIQKIKPETLFATYKFERL